MTQIFLETAHPIAFDSPDHLYPLGTAHDNSVNPRFNEKLLNVMGVRYFSEISLLDLGCSGGGFVQSWIDKGGLAVGVEGSDFSKKRGRAAWATLTDKYLFTADITQPFFVRNRESVDQVVKFDVITSWEVFEHLKEEELSQAIKNILHHLKEEGMAILSISTAEEFHKGHSLHQCVRDEKWWVKKFEEFGLLRCKEIENYFNGIYIRGIHQNAPKSFNLALRKTAPNRSFKLSRMERLLDRFHCSPWPMKIRQWLNLS